MSRVKFVLNGDDEIDFKMNGVVFEIWIETIDGKDKIVIRSNIKSQSPLTINPISRTQIEVS